MKLRSKQARAAVSLVLLGGIWPVLPTYPETIQWSLAGIDQAHQRAMSLRCENNLREIAFRARRWSTEHGGSIPVNLSDFINDPSSMGVLFCPANFEHSLSKLGEPGNTGHFDYDWFPEADWNQPKAPICRCRVHGQAALADGSTESQQFRFVDGWPAIVAGPLQQYATPGSPVTFEVQIAPNARLPVTYQWYRSQLSIVTNVVWMSDDGSPAGGLWTTNLLSQFHSTELSGVTNSSYRIPAVRVEDSDYYRVVVGNALGLSSSAETRLWVDPSVATLATNTHGAAIHCVNNIRQIALLGQRWSPNDDGLRPPSFAAMTNWYGQPAFGWPLTLFCRYDTARTAPHTWIGLEFANTSYELVQSTNDDAAAFCRCKVHGFYARADGQVVWQPRFEQIHALPDGNLELGLRTFGGLTTHLEGSSNLVDWTPLLPSGRTSTNDTLRFLDPIQPTHRVYRLRVE
jgi:hypothetical protein